MEFGLTKNPKRSIVEREMGINGIFQELRRWMDDILFTSIILRTMPPNSDIGNTTRCGFLYSQGLDRGWSF